VYVLADASVVATDTDGEATEPPRTACDMSTEDAVRATYTSLTGTTLSREPNTACVSLSDDFPGYARIGDFAYDRGCSYREAIYKCQMWKDGMQVVVFADAGWAKADQAGRAKIVFDWLAANGVYVVTSEPDPFTDNVPVPPGQPPPRVRKFSPPVATGAPDGGLSIQYWISLSGGMLPQVTYSLVTLAIGADGSIGEPKTLDSFTHTSAR
jgi:hypothetical protein